MNPVLGSFPFKVLVGFVDRQLVALDDSRLGALTRLDSFGS